MLVQIHILQNYAPSNLNRDDTGSPKDATFGGVRRGRISSQCLKRSIRRSEAFAEAFEQNNLLGTRTKLLPDLIQQQLAAMSVDLVIQKAIVDKIPEIGRESTKSAPADEADETPAGEENKKVEAKKEAETKTKQLIFISQNELRPLAEKLLEIYRGFGPAKWGKAKMAEITKQLAPTLPKSVDIAMFGRMTTSSAFEDVQAAVQVAHAISTHALSQEFDYYTAVDDISGETGAGMIGDIEFNSSTYYKYLNIHWEQLVDNLGGDIEVARQAVAALVEAAVTAQPSGKQNSFAANNLPDLVFVEISDRNLPVSYANAFLKPVHAGSDKSLMDASVQQLAGYLEKISKAYGLSDKRAYLAVNGNKIPGGAEKSSFAELLDWVAGQLPGG